MSLELTQRTCPRAGCFPTAASSGGRDHGQPVILTATWLP